MHLGSFLVTVALVAAPAVAFAGEGSASPKGAAEPSTPAAASDKKTKDEGAAADTAAAPEPEVSKGDKERANALFEEGRVLSTDGNHAAACEKFAQSHAIRPGIGVLFNLADCNEKIGKTGTAYRHFHEVVNRTRVALQEERLEVAQKRLAALEPRIIKIRIAVPEKANVSTVKLDGELILPEFYNKLIPIDPGEHTVIAESSKDEGEPFEATVQAADEGQVVTVAIPIGEGPKMTRDVGMIVGGSISLGVGALCLLGAGAVFISDSAAFDSEPGPLIALGVIGLAGIGVGIPLVVVGAKKRPVEGATPEVAIGPTSAALKWRF